MCLLSFQEFFLVVLSSCVKFSGSFTPRLFNHSGIRIYSAEIRGLGQLWAGSLKPGLRSTEILLWFGAQPPEEEAREGEWGRDVFLTLPPKSLWVTLGRIAELRPHLYLFLSVFICGIKAKSFTVLRIISNPPNITMKAGNNGRSKNQF